MTFSLSYDYLTKKKEVSKLMHERKKIDRGCLGIWLLDWNTQLDLVAVWLNFHKKHISLLYDFILCRILHCFTELRAYGCLWWWGCLNIWWNGCVDWIIELYSFRKMGLGLLIYNIEFEFFLAITLNYLYTSMYNICQ